MLLEFTLPGFTRMTNAAATRLTNSRLMKDMNTHFRRSSN